APMTGLFRPAVDSGPVACMRQTTTPPINMTAAATAPSTHARDRVGFETDGDGVGSAGVGLAGASTRAGTSTSTTANGASGATTGAITREATAMTSLE